MQNKDLDTSDPGGDVRYKHFIGNMSALRIHNIEMLFGVSPSLPSIYLLMCFCKFLPAIFWGRGVGREVKVVL